ncbi:hypothetical protein AQUCO_00300387v1 [Aquilegia coerulea]|uniref:Peroxidase n=1 Tax=Aquilegia coerulea TaxID=218851 RepID=A0A2G5EYI9_AQUCA|nr:hypothetical protein AQUCO_00300387v1 [Aquilegia coerulea]
MKTKFITYLVLILAISMTAMVSAESLRVGFYQSTCPLAELTVRRSVNRFVSRNPGIAAGLIRMHFHDCFVRGCDASVLLDSIPGSPSEKEHFANKPDIIAFAARDSACQVGGINYDVPAGRRDGRVSLKDEVIQNLPPPSFNATQLEDNFAKKGLSLDEMVTLSGAHSLGISHCSSFSNRLYTFNSTHPQDPSMDTRYAVFLKTRCPRLSSKGASRDPTMPLDIGTPNTLDNTYYKELSNHRGLLTSDQTLFDSPSTAGFVKDNILHPSTWAAKFALAMVGVGSIDVKTGTEGEIRKNCKVVN